MPERGTEGSVGYDLRIKDHVTLPLGKLVNVDTGVRIESPYPMLLMARSSLCKMGIMLAHSVGLVDPDYRGTLKLPLVYIGFSSLPMNQHWYVEGRPLKG